MKKNGIPVDREKLQKIISLWPQIQNELLLEVNKTIPVYSGTRFSIKKFEKYLIDNNISWPYTDENKLDMSDDTFRDMCAVLPKLKPLTEVRYLLNQMKLADLPIYEDSRNRCLVSPFSSKTSRNQPSTSKFIFGPGAWIRNLIQPRSETALAYIDWSQQEFGIAAALSKDDNMMRAYSSGDPYLEFAKLAKAAPIDATKKSHADVRSIFKACVLAVQYGMGPESLARRIQKSPAHAKELLELHRKTFSKFWKWQDQVLEMSASQGKLVSIYGWPIYFLEKEKTAANFLMQATGAEMLRLATIMLDRENIKICALVHDAILIESEIGDIESSVVKAQSIMQKSSELVLDGFSLSSESKIIKYPETFDEERGKLIWATIQELIRGSKNDTTCAEMGR